MIQRYESTGPSDARRELNLDGDASSFSRIALPEMRAATLVHVVLTFCGSIARR